MWRRKRQGEKRTDQPASRSGVFSFNLIESRTFADALSQRGFDAAQFYRVNARGNAKESRIRKFLGLSDAKGCECSITLHWFKSKRGGGGWLRDTGTRDNDPCAG